MRSDWYPGTISIQRTGALEFLTLFTRSLVGCSVFHLEGHFAPTCHSHHEPSAIYGHPPTKAVTPFPELMSSLQWMLFGTDSRHEYTRPGWTCRLKQEQHEKVDWIGRMPLYIDWDEVGVVKVGGDNASTLESNVGLSVSEVRLVNLDSR